jgi:hypothetical protein
MMLCRVARCFLTLAVAVLVICTIPCFATETWFNQRVTWKYGKEGLEWKTVIRNPRGQGEYQLVLSPLWAVEGGVIAVEIVIAPGAAECEFAGREGKWPRIPLRDNCRGTSKGVAKSKFGALRNFQVENIVLRVNIESFRRGRELGSGSGFCRECKNIQELSMRISVES